MSDLEEPPRQSNPPMPRTAIGGRYGSPTITVALPFARIAQVDTDLRDAVADLAALVARLAQPASTIDAAEVAAVRQAAEELVQRLAAPPA